MNQRIQELARQAGDYVNAVYTPPVRSKTPGKIWEDGHIGWNEQFQAKFAELIVRECNQAVLEVPLYYKDYRSQIEEAVIRDCARAVLQKFGVEQ